jgi:hypothetical protein
MTVFKFRDTVDGRFCYVIAKSSSEAIKTVEQLTSIPVELVDQRPIEEITPIVLRNKILPF